MALSEKTKLRIIDLADKGISQNEIARVLGINIKSVYKYCKEHKEVKNVGSKKVTRNSKKAGGSGGDQLKPGDKDIKKERSINNKNSNENTTIENKKIEFIGGSETMNKKEENSEEEDSWLCPNCGTTFKGKREECPGCQAPLECE